MIARGVTFDLLGISYYPRWHGTLEDLQANLTGLVQRYHRPVNVVEYRTTPMFAVYDTLAKRYLPATNP
jgi:arabinogalactan endo-1,4-beta-galactosidase